jgi:hypothetical protein
VTSFSAPTSNTIPTPSPFPTSAPFPVSALASSPFPVSVFTFAPGRRLPLVVVAAVKVAEGERGCVDGFLIHFLFRIFSFSS